MVIFGKLEKRLFNPDNIPFIIIIRSRQHKQLYDYCAFKEYFKGK
jgi:hypothetical protein